MQLKWKQLYKYAIDLFFPNRCPCCNGFIEWDKLLCDKCIEEIKITDEHCPKCGKKTDECICSLGLVFDKVICVSEYKGGAVSGIYNLKDSCNTNFAVYCGRELGKKLLDINDFHADYIIPVPMKNFKKRLRGYNQAELIAKEIRNITGTDISNDIIIKNKKVKDKTQHKLNAKERYKNAERLFIANKTESISGKSFIICDDVMTTGYTVNRCSRILKEYGASKIVIAVAAVTTKRKERKEDN